jgi:hypothetical protein
MTVGQISQEVQVTGEAPQVELTSSAIGATLTSQTAVELPLNGRDWTSLAALEPGVNNVGNIQQPTGSTSVRGNRGFGGQLAIAGTRPQMNNYRVDGISTVDATAGSPGSVLGVALGVDAIGEFSVLTSNYSAEYGRTAGGVVNAITKSGNNSFHGSAFWFIRDEGFDARNFYDPPGSIPPFHRNQFGGSGGGPIQKNKTFFFADYEGFRQNLGLTAVNNVPSDNARNGILNFPTGTNFPGGCVSNGVSGTLNNTSYNQCVVPVDSKIKPFLAFWPTPNGGLSGVGNTGVYNLVGTTIFKEDYVTTRIDHRFSDKDTLFGTYLFDDGLTDQPSALNLWIFGNTSRRNFVALEETHVFGPALANTVRFGFNRINPFASKGISVLNPLAGNQSIAAFPGLWSPSCCGAATGLTGVVAFNGNTILHHVWNSFQVYDDAFLSKAAHSLKFGFAFERMQTNSSIILTPNGSFGFPSLAAFLQNQPNTFSGAAPTGRTEIGARQSLFGAYVQDDWRFRKNLTINLGLRYEMVTVPTEVKNQLSNLLNLTDASPHLGSPYFNNPTLHNFAPRVGLAWDPFGNGKTSVRASFGMFDVLPLEYFFFWGQDRAAPFSRTLAVSLTSANQGAFPSGNTSFNPTNIAALPSSLEANLIEQNPPRSYSMIWSLNIQRQLTASTSLMIGYVGNRGVHNVDRAEELNEIRPTFTPSGLLWPCGPPLTAIASPGTAQGCTIGHDSTGATVNVPNPNVGQIVSTYWGGDSSYHALTAQFTKRMSHGFQFGASYTWSKSIDTGSSSTLSDNFTNSIINLHQYCDACRRAVSDFNVPHVLVVNYVWDLPSPKVGGAIVERVVGGWELGGIYTVSSGSPFTPIISGDALGMKGAAAIDYPSLSGAPGCDTPINAGDSQNYFKLNCFALPSAPALGTQCRPFPALATSCQNLQGNLGRNFVYGPGRMTWDLSVFKNNRIPRISESFNAQFRAELFNVLNRRNMGMPGGGVPSLFDGSGASISTAGKITSASTTARQIQFALKLIW